MKNDILDITSNLKFLEYDGIDISYHITGCPSDMTLVFIPGWAGAIEFWYKQIRFFADRFRVLVIDIPGFGHSGVKRQIHPDDPNDLSMEMLATSISKVILHEGVKSCVVVGHSMGGAVALCVGAKIPDIVKGVIGADSLVYLNLYSALTTQETRAFVEVFEVDFETSVYGFAETYFPNKSDAEQKEYVCNTMSVVAPKPALMILRNFLMSDLDNQLNSYPGPVYSIVSADTFEEDIFLEHYKERINVVGIADTGHFIMMDKPQAFNDAVLKTMFD